MTVTVVSAIVGDYDEPHKHCTQSVDWEYVFVDWGDDTNPRLAAKAPKLRPWDYCWDFDDGPWIWIDGSFEIVSPTFVEDVVAASAGADIAQWTHPARDCIYQEANASRRLPKYVDVPIVEQADHYRRIGHPTRWGLWAAGLIVYRTRCDYLADLWEAEVNRWGVQDQISEPVALRSAGLRPKALPHSLHNNPWLRHHPSRRHMLTDIYRARCEAWSDVVEHMERFYDTVVDTVAKVVVELGVRSGNSTAAFLAAVAETGGRLWSVDIQLPEVPIEFHESGRWTFVLGDDRHVADQLPESIDVLFIDSSHHYQHTLDELDLYGPRAEIILLHDTELDFPYGAPASDPPYPVKVAAEEWCAKVGRSWENLTNGNGLGIIGGG